MNARAFSLGEIARQAKEQRDIPPDIEATASSPVPNPVDSTETQDLRLEESSAMTRPAAPVEAVTVEEESPRPRKATPINNGGIARKTGPVLRPKGTSRPTAPSMPKQTAALSPALPDPAASPSPKPSQSLPRRQPPFNERYERMTTYLEKSLFNQIHELHQQGEFPKIASLINAAVREYLDRHYSSV
ncbi:hypothetical protein [Cohnella fermenti]|uniref:Uncharacterized protein n=1 Tax=Cohnella fermenti TaxID=2565925 RepID=A0A4S4C309_9BACL|nr:hypothetical protein [Cohnella fermenti]THF82105.1 hypothetical protein E6C55_06885 [Cohnella fermenti]